MVADMRFFADFLPATKHAHEAARLVIPNTGCQLAASLLALDLGRNGEPAEYVTGRYTEAPEGEHWWVEVGAVLLDPTRDQFDEDPFQEDFRGRYIRDDAKPASQVEHEATMQLRFQWAYNRRVRPAVKQVARQYGLDQRQVEEPIGLLSPAGR
jgi:hypothetical protein